MAEDTWQERGDLAAAAREVARLVITSEAPAEALAAAARTLSEVAKQLGSSDVGSRYDLAVPADGGRRAYMATHPLLGTHSAMAPPLTDGWEDDVFVTSGAFDARYEGPPGLVHPGFICFGFEYVLGVVANGHAPNSPTVANTITYRKPLKLGEVTRFEAKVTGVDGRKIQCHATLSVDDRVLGEAASTHITVEKWAAPPG